MDPADEVATWKAVALAKAFRGSMAPVRQIILRSQTPEEAQRQLALFFADWNPAHANNVLEEALQICAAAGAEYDPTRKRLKLNPNLSSRPEQARSTSFHEMMHWVHIHVPKEYAAAIKAHFEKRTAGEKVANLPGYGGGTKGKQDKWYEPYAGRVYGMPMGNKAHTSDLRCRRVICRFWP